MDEKAMMGCWRRLATVESSHPCLPGHFPGRPIVPAVVVLDHVRAAIAEAWPGRSLLALEHCKFLGPVLPGRPFSINLAPPDGDSVDFDCSAASDGLLLVKGRFRLDPARSLARTA